jgi:hypothetical protein
MDCHITRDKIQEGIIHLMPISSKEQTADLLTKALCAPSFLRLKDKLGMKNIFTPSLRGLLAINNKILFCYMS